MSIFKEREEAAEKEYVVKLEQSFHIRARRDRMLARWAADLIGRQDFDAYFGEIITADLAEPGDEGLFSKLQADMQSAGASIDAKGLREKMRQLLFDAAKEVRAAG
ncbi:ATPase inhibitor subunit zeta [Rhizobium calliandrae]|uniref:ATPase inhibitor subunit zeta n=1 Tax=Rhizobium calliandrae TaxID=1312182 RepID=A0ABT7KBB8_9HYPH|nr:ATPase inhibitor subunit zeta [Rhizobium calliandrae]MDL2405914.1 ATPase inhibitor subunit zeta [Rhizobium calliandrae]